LIFVMDIVRRNTDYALRAMVALAQNYGIRPVSSKSISDEQKIPYQLTCKLMQKLSSKKMITSLMGPKGGFILKREPSKITLLEIIEAIQEPLSINRCLLAKDNCPRRRICTIRPKLVQLQEYVGKYLTGITLAELAEIGDKKGKAKKS
jgi:Rrf2 family transcriptional regulator, iron-sulfur cluster assembly transcription factor